MNSGIVTEKSGQCYTVRLLTVGGRISAPDLRSVADLAERFAEGIAHLTVRQGVEIPGVPADKLDAFLAAMESTGLQLGLTGRRVRGITACPGAARCKYGQINSQDVVAALNERLGMRDGLPHKFKIAVAGCPNCCTKPLENDLGVVGTAKAFRLYVGGKMGRKPRLGTKLGLEVATQPALVDAADRIIDFFATHGHEKERFGDTLERVGVGELEQFLSR